MTNIVILGAGYGGILTALGLEKKFRHNKDFQITLVDKHDYQLFASNLYEVATAEEELVSVAQLKKSIALPLKQIFAGKKVQLLKGQVSEINQKQKSLTVEQKKLSYNYLVVALGSVSDYFGVEGAEKFSLALKTLPDALRIKNQIAFVLQAHRQDVNKKNIRIVVAGGGYTGVEFAAELSHEIELLAFLNSYAKEKIEIVIIEAMSQLIPGLSDRMSQDALWKLKERGVRVELSSPIAKVDEHFVELSSGDKMQYDVLVWTTGVKAGPVPFLEPMSLDKKNRIMVNEFFQTQKDPNIFVLGDSACILNANGKPAPATAQDAIDQAKYLASALPKIIKNQKPAAYKGFKHGFIVSLGGEWAILNYPPFYFKGWPAYVVRQLANMRYYAKVVGWYKAIKLTIFDVEIYSRND